MTDDELLDAARMARAMAYCPYSNFSVGAALIDENGQVHRGCNVENAAYPQGSCAETVAGGSTDRTGFCTPCGGCRQRISEFADENTRIIVKDDDETWHKYSLADLLPSSFHL
jgi:cytidine deaminase